MDVQTERVRYGMSLTRRTQWGVNCDGTRVGVGHNFGHTPPLPHEVVPRLRLWGVVCPVPTLLSITDYLRLGT